MHKYKHSNQRIAVINTPTPGQKKKKKNTSDPMATKAWNFESASRFSSSAYSHL